MIATYVIKVRTNSQNGFVRKSDDIELVQLTTTIYEWQTLKFKSKKLAIVYGNYVRNIYKSLDIPCKIEIINILGGDIL